MSLNSQTGMKCQGIFSQFQETSTCTFKYWNTFENSVSGALKSIEIFVSTEKKKCIEHIIKNSVVWEIL